MADEKDELIEKLLKEKADPQRRLAERDTVSHTGPGATATHGGTASGVGGAAIGRDLHGPVLINSPVIITGGPPSDTKTDVASLRQRYLSRLSLQCRSLPLAAMGGDADAQRSVTLDQVYIDLNSTLQLPDSTLEKIQHFEITDWSQLRQHSAQSMLEKREEERQFMKGDREAREQLSSLPALDALRLTPHMVLLGDPGSGKTSFVRIVVARLASGNPPPGVDAGLLPVIVALRDLALRLARVNLDSFPLVKHDDVLAEAVRDQMVADLAGLDCTGFEDTLCECLETKRCVLVFDGLDEVPQSLRERVRRAVLAAVARYSLPRVIVTCRKRSYEGEAVLPEFEAFTLAPFSEEQIETFSSAWYNAQKELGRVGSTQAEQRAQDLAKAALASGLHELAVNPMLLTTMALIHQQEVGLPKERVRLYSKAVEVLLLRWQNRHVSRDELADFLRNDRRVREVMERLAYEAHDSKKQSEDDEAADLSRIQAREILEEYLDDANQARDFLNYVDQRAGLLVGRGGKPGQPAQYSFPHRTFQEYLAGCHLLIGEDRERVEQFYARAAEGDRWNLVAQLSAEELFFNTRDGERRVLHLAYNLLPQRADSQQTQRATLWSGQMAELAGHKAIERDTRSPNGGAEYLQRLLAQLVVLLGSKLPASERCQAGDTLARLGDPRFLEAAAYYLPDDAWITLPHNKKSVLGFIEIPVGSFVMGEDEEQHEVTLPTYYMSCYPVTVAQYRLFMAEEREGDLPNHPITGISWHEAIAYCQWLTERLREWQDTPEPLATLLRKEGWHVTLPSEAEWEKAARGVEGLVYPWGNEWQEDRANTEEARIGHPSTVGCFPHGASPYGCQDMAGNVWEWTRSLWGKDWDKPDFVYPYQLNDGREKLDATAGVKRVLRGGSFWSSQRHARCASRSGNLPDFRGGHYGGFRLVLRPGLPSEL